MKEVLLHVGFHKTATTSIQHTCYKNIDKIASQGYHFAVFTVKDRVLDNHSLPFWNIFATNPEKYHTNILLGIDKIAKDIKKDLSLQLENILKTQKKIIFSGEDISVLPEKNLLKLRDYFLKNGFQVKVFCSVRKPYSNLCSTIQQQVKYGVETLENIQVPHKSQDIIKLKSVFENNINFFSFEEDCKKIDGPVSEFLSRVGVNPAGFDFVYDNEGLGNISTRLYAYLNKHFPITINGQKNPRGRDIKVTNFDQDKFLLNETELENVETELVKENSLFLKLLGENFCDNCFPISKNIVIDIDLAHEIYFNASKPQHISLAVMAFILKYKSFVISDFTKNTKFIPIHLQDIAPTPGDSNVERAHHLTFNTTVVPSTKCSWFKKKIRAFSNILFKKTKGKSQTSKIKKRVQQSVPSVKTFLAELEIEKSPSKALLSESGWIFLINDSNTFLRYLYGDKKWNENDLKMVEEVFKKRISTLKTQGAEYYKFIVPEKSVIYKEYLPIGFHNYSQSPERPAPKLNNSPALDFIFYSEVFLNNHKSCGLLYFKGDSHLNWLGSYFQYYYILSALNKRYNGTLRPPIPLSKLTPSLAGYDGDIFVQLNKLDKDKIKEKMGYCLGKYTMESLIKYDLSEAISSVTEQSVPDFYNERFFKRQTFIFENTDKSLPSCVVFRDSTSQYMINLIAQHFSRSVFIWHHGDIYMDVLEREKPDIVLHIMAERFVSDYPSKIATIESANACRLAQ